MADKISTVVLNVDLECDRCYKKIRRVLCKIQDKANIKTISYDEKNNAVMVSGPFDADKVCQKLCCKAGRVIKDMQIKGKENKDKDAGDKAKAAEKEAGGGKAEKKGGGKGDSKEAKADKAAAAAKPEKAEKGGGKDAKPEKKVKFDLDEAPAPALKPGKVPFPAGMTQADLAPLLEKLKIAKLGGPEPPRGEPIAPPMMAPPVPAAQGVAVPSIWPAPAGPISCYSYNPAYDQSSYYGGGYGYGCGGSCRCSSCAGGSKPAPGGYYGAVAPAPAPYDHQGWYCGNRHPYYQQQQCYEDPNAGCSIM
ncbi:protein PYRICULARIA ORYZAE RESISTANCE 21-like [Oryza brachyantha]|uniref:protein PYRICULARIA ORYZAE RESISTANCE 21-like n=1 Tax=Oryza brachyantha TaxID=4533 RepID=UPI001ADD27B0|nr:protein PYRICULARIA ORYZAE RESISTANCE 21-like [Oryza brachyantha]